MKSEWRVTMNPMMSKPFGVYRLRDISAVDHSGNRESHDTWYLDRNEAAEVAKKLNEEE